MVGERIDKSVRVRPVGRKKGQDRCGRHDWERRVVVGTGRPGWGKVQGGALHSLVLGSTITGRCEIHTTGIFLSPLYHLLCWHLEGK